MRKPQTVNARVFVQDVRSGMNYDSLITKYGLTEVQLNRAIQRLLDAEVLTQAEVPDLREARSRRLDLRSFAADLRAVLGKYHMTLTEIGFVIDKVREARLLPEYEDGEVTAKVGTRKKHRINAREFAEDVQLGMDTANLTLKYRLTEDQVEQVIERLIEAKLLTEAEVYDRTVPFDSQIRKAVEEAQNSIDNME